MSSLIGLPFFISFVFISLRTKLRKSGKVAGPLIDFHCLLLYSDLKKMMTKVREGGQGIGPLIGLLPQADRLQHRHHHVVLLLHNRLRYLEV